MESDDRLSVYPQQQHKRRSVRPTSLIPDPDVPALTAHWFHAIDQPVVDPLAIRRAKSTTSLKKPPKSPLSPKVKPPSKWIAFSKRDSMALEKAYQGNDVRAKVSVNEDQLFEVDVYERTISPVYWEGATYEVRRATWFMQADGSKWVPCEENLAEQIEIGYYKHKPYNNENQQPVEDSTTIPSATDLSSSSSKRYSFPQAKTDEPSSSTATVEEKKLEMTLAKQPVEKQWNLLGRYLGQYIVYTGADTAWLLSNSASSKIAKSIITRLTNKQNMGGTRLIRGYEQVEKQRQSTKTKPTTTKASTDEKAMDESDMTTSSNNSRSPTPTQPPVQDVDDVDQDEDDEIRKIDHLVFAVHGIGQKMTEKTGQNFVDDIVSFRKTVKTAYPTGIAATSTPQRTNGILVLPILWRQDIKFGIASDDDESIEADLGMLGIDDGCPTLDELTLDGIPNIRTVVSDVLMDIPLYMTPKYRDQMINIISKEMNRVYGLYTQRNPGFTGKVTIIGHSLGSMLAFDMLTTQPLDPATQGNNNNNSSNSNNNNNNSSIPHALSNPTAPPLNFQVQNFFAVGSPLGIILLLKGFKIGSRKSLTSSSQRSFADVSSTSASPIPICYPAVENLYNIFHKADPVAYRIEPLISRHYSAKMKPEPVPYVKGGLKGVFDAGYNVGSGIANRAGAMYESLKVGLTTNLLMRGFGLSRQQMYKDNTASSTDDDDSDNDDDDSDDDMQQTKAAAAASAAEAMAASDDSISIPSSTTAYPSEHYHHQHTNNGYLTPPSTTTTPPGIIHNDNNSSTQRIRSNSDPAYAFSSSPSIAMHRQPSSGLKTTHSRHSPPAPLPTQPHSHGARKLKLLNLNGRVDYALQEGLLENPYLNAFNAHMQYWQDIDVAAFIVRETYR
ncbi:unnamed protein product [Absidia cylindrospora]